MTGGVDVILDDLLTLFGIGELCDLERFVVLVGVHVSQNIVIVRVFRDKQKICSQR